MERKLVISEENLVKYPHDIRMELLQIMLFPEDEIAREVFSDAYITAGLMECSIEERAKYIQENIEHIATIFGKNKKAKELVSSTVNSRKSMGFSPVNRGSFSGQILCHLLKPSLGTLDKAYDEILARFDRNKAILERYYAEKQIHDRKKLGKPSKSSLKAIWGVYKNVSHLWAAEWVLSINGSEHTPTSPLFMAKQEQVGLIIREFLKLATFFRSSLIEFKNSHSEYLIDDDSAVWKIVDVIGCEYPAQEVLVENL